jgi:L-ascorbate metabolism protein UlaG (beta-lactamase superfamily)
MMHLRHFGHACVLIETETTRLLIDPGTLSSDFETLRDLDAVLVTHQHADHVGAASLGALMSANPGAQLIVDAGTAQTVADLGLTARVVTPGEALRVGGASLDIGGGEHAVVHADIPPVQNCTFLVDGGAFFHPGDSFFVPEQDVDVLGLPVSGPWLKLGETIDYLRAVGPRVGVPIHEAALANTATVYAYIAKLAPVGTAFMPLERATSTPV